MRRTGETDVGPSIPCALLFDTTDDVAKTLVSPNLGGLLEPTPELLGQLSVPMFVNCASRPEHTASNS